MNRYLGRAAYLVAFTLFLIPLLDSTTSVLPLRISESRWRYGTIGLWSNALMIPMAGVLIAFVTATALEHRRTLRTFGVIAWLGFAGCLGLLLAFILDAIQSQGGVRPEMHLAFIVGTATACAKLILGVLSFALFGIAGLKGAKAGAVPVPSKRPLLPMPDASPAKLRSP